MGGKAPLLCSHLFWGLADGFVTSCVLGALVPVHPGAPAYQDLTKELSGFVNGLCVVHLHFKLGAKERCVGYSTE